MARSIYQKQFSFQQYASTEVQVKIAQLFSSRDLYGLPRGRIRGDSWQEHWEELLIPPAALQCGLC